MWVNKRICKFCVNLLQTNYWCSNFLRADFFHVYTANFFPIKRAGKPRVTRGTPQHARKCDGDKW